MTYSLPQLSPFEDSPFYDLLKAAAADDVKTFEQGLDEIQPDVLASNDKVRVPSPISHLLLQSGCSLLVHMVDTDIDDDGNDVPSFSMRCFRSALRHPVVGSIVNMPDTQVRETDNLCNTFCRKCEVP